MNHKVFLIAMLILLMGFSFAQGQARSEATDEGAKIVSGVISFSSQGGDLYTGFDDDDDRLTTIAVVPSLFYFIAPGVGMGGDLAYNRASRGDDSYTVWGAGPKIGYFIDTGGNTIPFVSGGVNYLSVADEHDSVLIRKGHLAVAIEAGYILDRFKFEGASKSTTGNTIVIGAGFAGFLYE